MIEAPASVVEDGVAAGRGRGALIVNADDWGRDRETTDRIQECFAAEAISSASAMVFMADSERAAHIATQNKWDCGLHLNFTTAFSDTACPRRLVEHQQKVARFLRWSRFNSILFHPGLATSFTYLVQAQLDQFQRLYGVTPGRVDGHHHMHLCANVLTGRLIPPGAVVRRNFFFFPAEKSWINRSYRKFVDSRIAKRHRVVDYLFNLCPLVPLGRLQRIISLARHAIVELEAHPVNPDELQFLTGGGLLELLGDLRVSPAFAGPPSHAHL